MSGTKTKKTTVLDIVDKVSPFLDLQDLLTVLRSSRSALNSLSERGTYELLRLRYSHAQIDEYEPEPGATLRNGLSLIRGLCAFYSVFEKSMLAIGSSKGLRIDTIFDNAEFFEEHCDETELYNYILERREEIVGPEWCHIVKDYCSRRGQKEAALEAVTTVGPEPEPLEITLHEYRWGAHNPIGFRARDVEIISTFFLKPSGSRYTSCGESDFYEKLDMLKEKARSSSLMECLTPTVVWLGGQRRADVARGRGLSV